MSKYNLIPLKEHNARTTHTCFCCSNQIDIGKKIYYQSDRFLQNLSKKKFCKDCFNKGGQKLLEIKKRLNRDQRTLIS